MKEIKVYSVRNGEDIRNAMEQGADWMSLDFTPNSPRFVSMLPTHAGIIPDRADDMPSASQLMPKKVGVFVDEMPQNIITRVVNYQLDIVLLNGNETPTMVRNLRSTLDPDIHQGILFMKGVTSKEERKKYEYCVDGFLVRRESESDECGALQGCVAVQLYGIDGTTEAEGHFVLLPSGRQ